MCRQVESAVVVGVAGWPMLWDLAHPKAAVLLLFGWFLVALLLDSLDVAGTGVAVRSKSISRT